MGFVKLSDDLKNWAWIDDPKTVYVYVRLLLGAAWGDFDYRNIRLKRGQIAISQREFAKECKITHQQLRTALNRLTLSQKITQSTTHKYSIITLVEYDCDTQPAAQRRHGDNTAPTQRQHSDNTPTLYITNKHNSKQPNNALTREGGVLSESFEIFWNAYPKKTAKQQALKAFQKLNPDEDLLSKILASLERQRKSVQWTKDNGQFIPYPATWLNGRRWEDESEVQNGKLNTDIGQRTREEWLAGFE